MNFDVCSIAFVMYLLNGVLFSIFVLIIHMYCKIQQSQNVSKKLICSSYAFSFICCIKVFKLIARFAVVYIAKLSFFNILL